MTSVEMRTNPHFLRNGFAVSGEWEVPVVKKQEISLDNLRLIACSDTRFNDCNENQKCGVHFYVDDYKFTAIYNYPERSLNKFAQYRFLLTPDYSTYADMNYWRQLESIAHSRWVGAFWQSCGLLVVPTISWSDVNSFSFCFDGVERGSIVSVGMIGCKHAKDNFLRGYNAMLEKIEPSAIIVFGSPFPEMDGNIIPVDYRSSRKVVR